MVKEAVRQQRGEELIQGIGQRLAARRRAKGMTQAVLAEQMGIAEESLSRLESGKVAISLERLVRFCTLLDLPMEELLMDASVHPTDEVRALIRSMKDLPPTERTVVLDSARHLASLLRKTLKKG